MNLIKNIADHFLLIENFCHLTFSLLLYVQPETLPLQLTHELGDSKLSCFSFLKLFLVWIYCRILKCCPHKCMRDWTLVTIISSLYQKPLSAYMPHFIAKKLTETDVSTVNCFLKNNYMICSHISRSHFLICEIPNLLHDYSPLICRYLPCYLKVLGHSWVWLP